MTMPALTVATASRKVCIVYTDRAPGTAVNRTSSCSYTQGFNAEHGAKLY